MLYVVKFFSEIAIKSKPVRRQLLRQLSDNLRAVLQPIDPEIRIDRGWDKFRIATALDEPEQLARLQQSMRNIAGITYILEVKEHPLPAMAEIVDKVLPDYADRLRGKTFAVRCKRSGRHAFTSVEVEREVGGALLARSEAAGVNLTSPEVTVDIEISDQSLFVIARRHRGLGGFPIGSIDAVLSVDFWWLRFTRGQLPDHEAWHAHAFSVFQPRRARP